MRTTEAEGGTGLATERLDLRPVIERDIAEIVTLAGDAAVAEWTASIRHPLSEAEVREWLAGRTARHERVFAIRRKGETALIGAVGLTVGGEDEGGAEIGYWIGRPYWGRGYATEAVRRVLLYGFGALGLEKIAATVFPGNDASVKVLTKAGFVKQHTGVRISPARGGEREVIVYILSRSAFARATLSQAVGRR